MTVERGSQDVLGLSERWVLVQADGLEVTVDAFQVRVVDGALVLTDGQGRLLQAVAAGDWRAIRRADVDAQRRAQLPVAAPKVSIDPIMDRILGLRDDTWHVAADARCAHHDPDSPYPSTDNCRVCVP